MMNMGNIGRHINTAKYISHSLLLICTLCHLTARDYMGLCWWSIFQFFDLSRGDFYRLQGNVFVMWVSCSVITEWCVSEKFLSFLISTPKCLRISCGQTVNISTIKHAMAFVYLWLIFMICRMPLCSANYHALTNSPLLLEYVYWYTGGWINIKMPSYQYRKSHCGDKTILRPSYLHNGISYTDKMTSLYWIRALIHNNANMTIHTVTIDP